MTTSSPDDGRASAQRPAVLSATPSADPATGSPAEPSAIPSAVPSVAPSAVPSTALSSSPSAAAPHSRQDRLDAVLDLVLHQGRIAVEEVMEHMGVSAATARRDLDALAQQQLIVRTRGGGSVRGDASALPQRYRAARASRQKERIAARAAQLARPGSVLAMNGGTTTTALAHELSVGEAFVASAEPTILVTNAINIAQELAVRRHLQLVVTGGVVRARSFELVGQWAESLLAQISIDTLFLGANGVDARLGVCAHSESESTMAAALVGRSAEVVVLADASKLGHGAFARICELERVSRIITDDAADPAHLAALRSTGVEVEVV